MWPPLINLWKINELLHERFNRTLKHKWMAVKQKLLRSQASMALRYIRDCVPQPFEVGDYSITGIIPISGAGRHITAKLVGKATLGSTAS
jgi:hypothetical protein